MKPTINFLFQRAPNLGLAIKMVAKIFPGEEVVVIKNASEVQSVMKEACITISSHGFPNHP